VQALYTLSVHLTPQGALTHSESRRAGTIPTESAANFVYNAQAQVVVFSADVYPDRVLSSAPAHGKEQEERSTSARVYDGTFVRHWDVWRGDKSSALFVVALKQESSGWELGNSFVCPMKGTSHVSD
jgi:hypothetical protein